MATALLAISLTAASSLVPARAQNICPGGEGKLANGTCVNPQLAEAMRLRAILMTQLKISQTALPIGPRLDYSLPRASQFNYFELGRSGNFSTNPFPPSP
jgi:hypothetical protein